jgi:hypothetical protein
MSTNELKKFSYSKPLIVGMKGQKVFAACAVGGNAGTASCTPGNGAISSCAGGTGVGVDLCQNGTTTTSGSRCDTGGGGS